MAFVRTCQECGNKQEDRPPDKTKELSDAYRNKKCKKCHSEALDYGSFKVIEYEGEDEDFKRD